MWRSLIFLCIQLHVQFIAALSFHLLGDYTWERMDSTSTDGEVPEARFGHCCSYYNGKIYMYGGRNRQRYQVFGSQGSVLTYEIGMNP